MNCESSVVVLFVHLFIWLQPFCFKKQSKAQYHTIGVTRTKPGRGEHDICYLIHVCYEGDPTDSMSCSDKIAKCNVLGIVDCRQLSAIKSFLFYFEPSFFFRSFLMNIINQSWFSYPGIQGSLLSQLISPIYLSSIIIGDAFSPIAARRSLCERIQSIQCMFAFFFVVWLFW